MSVRLGNFDLLLRPWRKFGQAQLPVGTCSYDLGVESWANETILIPEMDAIPVNRQELHEVHVNVGPEAVRNRFRDVQRSNPSIWAHRSNVKPHSTDRNGPTSD